MITKQGIFKTGNLSEFLVCSYDPQIYIEPDGSAWTRIVHHANCATKFFASNDPFTTTVYKDADRWFKAALCNRVDRWELMVKQVATSGGTEQKFRWVQNANPMTCAYSDVVASKVTYNTSSGYSSSSYGGLFKKNSSTYLAVDNNTSGSNWYGAFGAWSSWNNGIPGWNSTAITTGYFDLYLRIDNISIIFSIGNETIEANSFIEW